MKIMTSSPITAWQVEIVRFHFLGLQKSLQIVTTAMKLKDACSLEENL